MVTGKTFVWCGNRICEERDATASTTTKRFFAEGEQRIGGDDAGSYYYSRDHLGSIREVTDSNGSLVSQLDYDAWGNETVVSGNMSVDFGFTGHYFHQPSGLNLTRTRAYNPTLGRWINRDPLENAELSEGPNLYAYVGNNPIFFVDPLGLCYTPEQIDDARNRINGGIDAMKDILFRLANPGGTWQQFLIDRRQIEAAGQIVQTTGKNPIIDSWEYSYASITFGINAIWNESFPLWASNKAGWAEQWLDDELARSYEFLDYLNWLEKDQQCKKCDP